MATLPPITNTDVGGIVKQQRDFFFPEGSRIPGDDRYSSRPTRATPAAMLALIDQLDKITDDTNVAAAQSGLTQNQTMAQWSKDSANWVLRLNHYRSRIEAIPADQMNTLEGADAIYFTVTAPLLDGVFYEVLPGINLTNEEKQRMATQSSPYNYSNRKPPDVYVPFSLGNQVVVFREHQSERWAAMWKAIKESVAEKAGQATDAMYDLVMLAKVAVGTLILGTTVYLGFRIYDSLRPRAVSNPRLENPG